MEQSILNRLRVLADEPYRMFTQALIPDGKPVLGVRMGPLRALAKELGKEGWDPLDHLADDTFHEQTLLRAIVMARADMPEHNRIQQVEKFLKEIDNWAVCDSMCASFAKVEQHRDAYLAMIRSHIADTHPYAVRFCVVMLLMYFLEPEYLRLVQNLLVSAETEHHYVRMAVAWAATSAFSRHPDICRPWLESRPFSTETMRMTVQKIRDSRQVSPERKAWAATLRA